MSSDEAIQLTNNNASSFKSYAVSRGYWSDPYVSLFSPVSTVGSLSGGYEHERKAPEMSRGYFARVNAMRTLVDKFLSNFHNFKCQIINLGAGYDTLYFNLFDRNVLPFKYIEIDFQKVVRSKIRLIKSKKQLMVKIKSLNEPDKVSQTQSTSESTSSFKLPFPTNKSHMMDELHSDVYHLISADLRNLNELDEKLSHCGIERNLPTLFLSECVLIYMNEEDSNGLIKYLFNSFENCCFVNYEQVNLNDKFGEIMLSNMEMRDCKLHGLNSCLSIQTQIDRFVLNNVNPDLCKVITMTDFYKNKMDRQERERIETIEFLDETELLFQLLDHYCIGIAANQPRFKEIFSDL